MDSARRSGASRQRPPRGAQPQRQVEVLVVEEDPLVEAADRLEGGPRVERRAAGRAERVGRRRGRLARLAVQVVEAHQGAVGDDPGRVDQPGSRSCSRTPATVSAPAAAGSSSASTKRGSQTDVVVEQDQRVAARCAATARFSAGPKPRFSPSSSSRDLGELGAAAAPASRRRSRCRRRRPRPGGVCSRRLSQQRRRGGRAPLKLGM